MMQTCYRKSIIDNGIRVVSEHMENYQGVSIGVWIQAGSRHESIQQNGISHLLEHMLFKGTSQRNANQIALSLESRGGSLNAFTERDHTCYFAQILSRDLAYSVEILSDLLQHPLLSESDLRNEKKVILEEIMNVQDTPEELIHDLFINAVFKDQALGKSILGSETSIKNITSQHLADYLKDEYHSNQIVISAAGRVDHETLCRTIQEYFVDLSKYAPRKTEDGIASPGSTDKVSMPISQNHYCLGTLGLKYSDSRKYALIILNTLLGGGMSSRLFQRIREQEGLVYSIYSFFELWQDCGIWGVYTSFSPTNTKKVVQLINESLEDLVHNPLSQDELERTKSQLIGNLMLSLDDSYGRMNRMAKMELFNHTFKSVEEIIYNINNVRAEDVLHLANALFVNQERYTLIIETAKHKEIRK